MHAASGHASASGWVRRKGSVEEQPGRELTGEVERGRQRETFACDALPIRCRERLPHGYMASLRSLANATTNPRAKGAAGPGAEGHQAAPRKLESAGTSDSGAGVQNALCGNPRNEVFHASCRGLLRLA